MEAPQSQQVAVSTEVGFSELLSDYESPLFHFARRITGSDSAALRIVEAVMIEAFKGLTQQTIDESFAAWLFRRTVSASREYLQSLRGALVVEGEEEVTGTTEGSAEPTRLYETALRELPLEYREVFLLRDANGFSVEEAASILGISSSEVRERTVRARLMLRRVLHRISTGSDWQESFSECARGDEPRAVVS